MKTLLPPGAPPAGSADRSLGLGRFFAKSAAIADMELRKLRHDPTELFTRALQPALWLLIFGQCLGGGTRALVQAVVIVLLALALGVRIRFDPLALGGAILLILLGAAVFSTFSLIIACIVKTRERFMGIGQVLTMPLFFASNAIYPTSMMPAWLQAISHVNPLTYQVDGLRALLLAGAPPAEVGIGTDLVVLTGALAVLVFVSARMYPRIAR